MPMSPRLLRPRAAGGFDPRAIADLGLWLDASDTSTVTLNGSTVSEWRSKGARSVAATQSTASLQPTYSVSAVNGRAALTASSVREMAISAFPYSNTVTAFTVLAISGKGASFCGIWTRGALNQRHLHFIDDQNRIFARRSSNLDSTSSAITLSSSYFISRCELSDTLSRLSLNGVSRPDNTATFTPAAGNQNMTMFRFPGTVNDGILGGIAEFLYYERNLSSAEITSVEQYLSRKYAITVA